MKINTLVGGVENNTYYMLKYNYDNTQNLTFDKYASNVQIAVVSDNSQGGIEEANNSKHIFIKDTKKL